MVIYHIDTVILDIDMGDEANDMGDDSIDTVISRIDMRYLVTLPAWRGATVLDDILDPGTSPRSLS